MDAGALGRRRRRGGTGFDPLALYAAGEAGIWADPSDLTPEKISWRRNLLTWSEQFDNSAWEKQGVTVTANNATAPDGSQTADLITGTGSPFRVRRFDFSTRIGVSYVISIYVKPGTSTTFALDFINTANGPVFTFATNTWSTISGWTTGYEVDANGWYRLWGARVATSDTGGPGYVLSGTTTAWIWGAQFEIGTVPSSYQRITDFTSDFLAAFPTHALYQDSAGTTPVTALVAIPAGP